MRPTSFMLIAGEASGDRLAAELVISLRKEWWKRAAGRDDLPPLRSAAGPTFFGAGGSAMREAGVDIVEDMTHRAVIGLSAVVRQLPDFLRLLNRLEHLAFDRQPDVILCVDYGGFNLRFQSRIRRRLRSQRTPFNNWQPKLIQFVSPQVWASRPGRAARMEGSLDLLVSILPFEKAWFAQHAPRLRVEFVGHPLISRHATAAADPPTRPPEKSEPPLVVLLPGSRRGELHHHLPVLREAVDLIGRQIACRFKMIVPTETLAILARTAMQGTPVEIGVGRLDQVLPGATVALSKTGTITLELVLFGVPAVTFYKTSWLTYWPARQVVTVTWLSMPNLLANAPVFPELVQQAATGEALAAAALEFLRNAEQRRSAVMKLRQLVPLLGAAGAPDRAAEAVLNLFPPSA